MATFTVGGDWVFLNPITAPNIASWTNVTGTSQAMIVGGAYVANNVALVTFTLPVSANIGDILEVKGAGAGGWEIQTNVGQIIELNDMQSLVSGSINSTNFTDGIKLVCTVANIKFSSVYFSGNININ